MSRTFLFPTIKFAKIVKVLTINSLNLQFVKILRLENSSFRKVFSLFLFISDGKIIKLLKCIFLQIDPSSKFLIMFNKSIELMYPKYLMLLIWMFGCFSVCSSFSGLYRLFNKEKHF